MVVERNGSNLCGCRVNCESRLEEIVQPRDTVAVTKRSAAIVMRYVPTQVLHLLFRVTISAVSDILTDDLHEFTNASNMSGS